MANSNEKIGKLLAGTSKSAEMLKTLSDLRKQGAAYINTQTQAAANNAYLEKQKLLETQRKYGITGGAAATQLMNHELQTKKLISDVQNKSSIEWWKTAGAQMAQYDILQDRKNKSLIQGLAQKVSDGQDVTDIIEQTKAADVDNNYDWDTIGILKDMTQDEANTFMDLFKFGGLTGGADTGTQSKVGTGEKIRETSVTTVSGFGF